MGFPHPTIDIPGSWPEIESELRGLRFHDDYSTELLRGLQVIAPSLLGTFVQQHGSFHPTATTHFW